ncbi:ATP-grasp domain-containing protein [Myxococcota bacterium]|nr:ATP-grasp domain-containing protein [Myxococcota bacterium]
MSDSENHDPIRRLAIVNRGEAAMRCVRGIKSLRALEGCDLSAVVLYTQADREAPFVRHADRAELIQSEQGDRAAFLDHDLLIEALTRTDADAVWPGWGFVAENPDFVDRLETLGIRFLGPSAEAMRFLGDKISSKKIAEAAGIPVTPWSGESVSDESEAQRVADSIGYPVVVKASAGGGGRGIRMVDEPDQITEAFRSASNEAESAFGDSRLFIEKKVSGGRHIEVQIVADLHGNTIALGCRDCSVQRRHQKVIEEAPPPGLSADLQSKLCDAAVQIAKEVGYSNVGTVEFLVRSNDFYFLEMNPRLQVEHGITEAITGADLVHLQIRVARGESLEGLQFHERGVAIEGRVCAEDPDAGYLPSPGRIARFEPALDPRVRIDSGVTTGSTIPSAFDSLIAKVISTGPNREEARARLSCALRDFDLIIEGGATNKGFLLDILESDDFRTGGVDTTWLDRFDSERTSGQILGLEALIAASILTYQTTRHSARLNFYADTANISASSVPTSRGQVIDLTYGAEQYQLQVFAVGAWRYRVHLDDRVAGVTLREEGQNAARLMIEGRSLRILHDVTDVGLRIEVEGHPHRFGLQTIGQVRASTPAMVVTVHVKAGDSVEAGQTLGVLEAMKMEIGFDSPIAGVVKEVRALKGQQVAAGDVLVVIDPGNDDVSAAAKANRLMLPDLADPLQPLFTVGANGKLGAPDLVNADHANPEVRRNALDAVREEVRRVLLGYDANPERAEQLAAFLDAPVEEGLSEEFLWELAEIRNEIVLFANLEQLFIRAPRASISGELGPSNDARLRMFVRRLRAGGAGLPEEFLGLVRTALTYYGIDSLNHDDALERAVMRLLASQASSLRGRLMLAVLGRVSRLARSGIHLGDDRGVEEALQRIVGMRGLVSHAVADAAIDASYLIFELPRIEHMAGRTDKQFENWLHSAATEPEAPPEEILQHLAEAPINLLNRVSRWLTDDDPARRAIAVAAHLRRLYSPSVPARHVSSLSAESPFERIELADGRVVLASALSPVELTTNLNWLEDALNDSIQPTMGALEVFVPVDAEYDVNTCLDSLRSPLEEQLANVRITINFITPDGSGEHRTFVPSTRGLVEDTHFHGIHPETAQRIDLERLRNFELERIPASDGIYCFFGTSHEIPSDERAFVLADVRGRSPELGNDADLYLPAFEHAFYEATRSLRAILSTRDAKRRLHWNRIVVFVAAEILLRDEVAELLARRLAPATRNLGIEKIVARLRLLDRENPTAPAVPSEIIISDITGSNMEMMIRSPHTDPLEPRSDYERKIVEARRRRLVYPYEIIRMLTGRNRGQPTSAGEITNSVGQQTRVGVFDEYDLDTWAKHPIARNVSGRPYGLNSSAVVFGIISTPTDKHPEGMRRVIILSDPSKGMGSLAAPECDRIVAALELAEKQSLPVEWIPVSSGARIAMESGTENLDATARVVKSIVQFTQNGGIIHVIVHGVNVGAQSYFDSLATMLMHCRGALIMTPRASMVLTGRAALEASGAVSAEDEEAIGGFERIMGPNGEAQYFANDLTDAYRILYEHYRHTYVSPGENRPRSSESSDPRTRSISDSLLEDGETGFRTVGEIFSHESNPGRKRPFPMRSVMTAVIDQDSEHLERWRSMTGAETSIVWDAHIGGYPVSLIGIESQNVAREGYRSLDGPESWTGGTLFPLSSKKTARAINAASSNRPVVVLANLSGFDGSPESMRKLQLEYGAEIARAVVNFQGPIIFLVVSRYHGGAYVVFSQELNPQLKASALTGSYASVIGGGPAAAVVFAREVRARASTDPRVVACEKAIRANPSPAARVDYDAALTEASLEVQAELANQFDTIHSVERARRVGSLSEIIAPSEMRTFLISQIEEGLALQSTNGAPVVD